MQIRKNTLKQRGLRQGALTLALTTSGIAMWNGKGSAAFAVENEQSLPCRASEFKSPEYARLVEVQKIPGRGAGSAEFQVSWKAESEKAEERIEQPVSGARFEVARCLSTGRWAVVGKGIAEGRSGQVVDGRVTSVQSSPRTLSVEQERELAQTGNMYWRPMVGDVVIPVQAHISNTMRITPKMQFAVGELFERNPNGSYSFDLSEEGRQKLRDHFGAFKSTNGRLMIEGVAQKRGQRAELRLQSQVRAKTVAQFLARDFKIEPDKIVSVGYGSEGMSNGFVPVAQWPELDMSESITLRMMPM